MDGVDTPPVALTGEVSGWLIPLRENGFHSQEGANLDDVEVVF